jgi:hypothetical protein
MQIIKAPNSLIFNENYTKKLFLAGSIEMGNAIDWQGEICEALKNTKFIILNPRRDDWDKTWEQKIDNPKFREQVQWELNAMDEANIIAMYFDVNTKSPISLLELGLFARSGKLIVYCPFGFWRKGNVDIVCRRYSIKQCISLDDFILTIEENE